MRSVCVCGGVCVTGMRAALPSVTTKHARRLNLQDRGVSYLTYTCVTCISYTCVSYILITCTVEGGH